jgi:hypothetical protein
MNDVIYIMLSLAPHLWLLLPILLVFLISYALQKGTEAYQQAKRNAKIGSEQDNQALASCTAQTACPAK